MADDLAAQRQDMLESQLRGRGLNSPRVLAALARVPRERFLPVELQADAYADRAIGIDCGQTMSQPYIVALMTDALDLHGHEKVLEIGTGSGYQAAVLAELAASVITIERHTELARRAARTLEALGYDNVRVLVGDGSLGKPEEAPFDAITVTAGAGDLPPALFAQLAEGGRLVIPVGDARSQVLKLYRKVAGRPQVVELTACRFVPLIGAAGQLPV